MGTVNVVLSTITNAATLQGLAPLPDSMPVSAENVTSGATSAATTGTASATVFKRQVWTVTSDTAVYIKFAASPTATAGGDWYLPAGASRDFAVSVASEKVAVIDV